MRASRNWCAVCEYKGMRRFVAGTFMARHDAKFHEIEALAGEFLDTFLPARPRILDLVPGVLWFHAEPEAGER